MLRVSTLVISLAGLIFVYLLLLELGYDRRNCLMAVFVLLFNPFHFPWTSPFFTDHFFTSLLFSAIYFYYRAFKEKSGILLFIASLATCAAILVRQNGILITAAALIYLVIYERSLRHIIRKGLLIALLPLISMLVFTYCSMPCMGPLPNTSDRLTRL